VRKLRIEVRLRSYRGCTTVALKAATVSGSAAVTVESINAERETVILLVAATPKASKPVRKTYRFTVKAEFGDKSEVNQSFRKAGLAINGKRLKTDDSDPNVFTPAAGGKLDAKKLEQFVLSRSAAGASKLSVAAGTYSVAGPEQPGGYGGCGAHVCFGHGSGVHAIGFSNVALDMTGVTLIMNQRNRTAVYVQNAVDFSLTGLTTQYAVHPTNQAVLHMKPDGSYTATVDGGYPLLDWQAYAAGAEKNGKSIMSCNVFDPKTLNWKPGTADLPVSMNATAHPRTFAIDTAAFHPPRSADAHIEGGDLLGCRPREAAFCFHVQNCSASVFTSITLAGGTSFGYFMGGANGKQNIFDSVRIVRPPKPNGASAEPLLAVGADGFHNAGNRIGPKIINSYFERMYSPQMCSSCLSPLSIWTKYIYPHRIFCTYFLLVTDTCHLRTDDGIAIHGAYALVCATLNRTSVVLQTEGVYVPDIGDLFRLYSPAFIPATQDFTVTSLAKMDSEWRPAHNESKTLPRNGFHFDGPYYAIEFKQPLPTGVAFDWVMNNADRNGNGFILRNNSIHDHRARGVRVPAADCPPVCCHPCCCMCAYCAVYRC